MNALLIHNGELKTKQNKKWKEIIKRQTNRNTKERRKSNENIHEMVLVN